MQIGNAMLLKVGTAVVVPYLGKQRLARVTALTQPVTQRGIVTAWVTATIQLSCTCSVTIKVPHKQVKGA